jgi:hypothetical protein
MAAKIIILIFENVTDHCQGSAARHRKRQALFLSMDLRRNYSIHFAGNPHAGHFPQISAPDEVIAAL